MRHLLGREKVIAVLFYLPPFSIQRATIGYRSPLKPVHASDEERPGGTPNAKHTAKMATLTVWKSVSILTRWIGYCLALVNILN